MASPAIQDPLGPFDDSPSKESWMRRYALPCKEGLTSIFRHVQTFRFILSHPRVPFRAKAVAACSLMYLVSPIQLIPTFIPVIGQMDDLLVIAVGMSLVRRMIPAEIFEESKQQHQVRSAGEHSQGTPIPWNQEPQEMGP